MKTARCPICKSSFEFASLESHRPFPFCSERCKLLDLGRWLDSAYNLPGRPDPDEDPDAAGCEPETDDS